MPATPQEKAAAVKAFTAARHAILAALEDGHAVLDAEPDGSLVHYVRVGNEVQLLNVFDARNPQ